MKNSLKRIIALVMAFAVIGSAFGVSPAALTANVDDISVDWQNPTEIVEVEMQDRQFIISTRTDKGKINNLYLSFPSDGGFRLNADNTGFFSPDSVSDITYSSEGAAIVMKAGDTTVKFFSTTDPWRIEVYNQSGEMVVWFTSEQISFGYDEEGALRKVKTASYAGEDEKFYGLGERFSGFIQNGKQIEMWNMDALSQLSYSYGDHNVGYKNVPLLHSNYGYSIFHNSNYYGIVDVAKTKSDECSFEFYGPVLDMYIWTVSTLDNIDKYCLLTGSSVTVPKYALSYWAGQSQSMWLSEGSEPETVLGIVKDKIEQYEALNTPIKVIFLEGVGGNSTYSSVHDYLNSEGIKFLAWSDSSFRSVDDNISESQIAEQAGLGGAKMPLVKWDYARLSNFYGSGGERYVDYSNPDSVKWLIERFTKFMDKGLIGLMVDYNDFIPADAYYPYAGFNGTVMHNRSQYYYAKAFYEALEQYYGEGNFVNIVRAGTAGSQSFGAVFGGDQGSTFLGLRQSVSALISSASSGFNVWGSDIGGLGTGSDPRRYDAELYARWLQLGTFSPLMRAHGQTGWRDPWNYGEADSSNRIFQKYYWTRESIVELINSGIIKASVENYPLVQGMVIAFPEETALAENNTQYMLCDSLLVCPVTESGETSLSVQFPEGRWVSIWDGSVATGGERTVSATVDTIPVYLKAGAAFPSKMGDQLRFGAINTAGNTTEVLVTAPATEENVNTIYRDKDTVETVVCDKVGDNIYSITSDAGCNNGIILAMGCNANKVTVDGTALEKLTERPTASSTQQGYYCDLESNTTIIVAGGGWKKIEYTDSTEMLVNLALNAAVTGENINERYVEEVKNITDGDYGTYLTVLQNDTSAAAVIDLGKSVNVDEIRLVWGNSYAREYLVEASVAGGEDAEWVTLSEYKDSDGGTDVITLDEMQEYRYIKVSNLVSSTKIGSKLAEVEVYGDTVMTEAERAENMVKAETPAEPEEALSALQITAIVLSGVALAAVIAGAILIILNKKKV